MDERRAPDDEISFIRRCVAEQRSYRPRSGEQLKGSDPTQSGNYIVQPTNGAAFTPGYWREHPGGWVWIEGRWNWGTPGEDK